ncbi:alpha-2,8-sialyltransferase 8F-like isoform X2 [Apostichopus japonicus]|uniref:alpha-2,8-sialyltransferase 8F-like isoform X2 n=1 Tax=Stichopus japonicus TaxID=307972 RepID=UPI003AB382EC
MSSLCCIIHNVYHSSHKLIKMSSKIWTGKFKIFVIIAMLAVSLTILYYYLQELSYRPGLEESRDALFIYHEVLNQVQRNFSKDAITQLRNEILQFEMADSERYFILSQENTPLHTKLSYYLPGLSRSSIIDDTIWSSLPKVSPFAGKHFQRCSLVGNGGILRNSSCGQQIDAADFVFRCNLAPVKMFQEDAGSKTNFTTMNPTIINTRYNNLDDMFDIIEMNSDIGEHHGLLWVPCLAYSGSDTLCKKIRAKYDRTDPVMVIGHPDHYRSIKTFWKKRDQSNRLSTGFYLLSTAIQLCDEVHLFGFWPFDGIVEENQLEKVPYHYYDDLERSNFHTFSREFHSLLKLHLQGVLSLHPHHCHRN